MKKLDISKDTFQIILFDFDGVIAESTNVKTEAFAKLFSSFGDEIVNKVVKHHIENGGISRYKKIQYYYSEYLNEPLSEEKLNDIAQQFSDIVVDKVIEAPLVNGVQKFLDKHYEDMNLYIVSGTPQKELELVVKRKHIEKYFKGVYGIPDTKPAITRWIIAENKCCSKKVIYIGDSLSDYYNALEAGIQFLGRVPKGMSSVFPNNVQYISDFYDLL